MREKKQIILLIWVIIAITLLSILASTKGHYLHPLYLYFGLFAYLHFTSRAKQDDKGNDFKLIIDDLEKRLNMIESTKNIFKN